MLTFREVVWWVRDLKFSPLECGLLEAKPLQPQPAQGPQTLVGISRDLPSKAKCLFSSVPVWLKISISAVLFIVFYPSIFQ